MVARRELIDAVKQIVKLSISPEDINEHTIQDSLYSSMIPDVDLMIRPGGEKRLSNFLLWQCANSTFYFTNTCWPSIAENEIMDAIQVYNEGIKR